MRSILTVVSVAAATCWLAGQAYGTHPSGSCFMCHVPHHAGDPNDPAGYGVPLWTGDQTGDGLPTFVLYSSKTFDKLGTDISQPDGASKLCLGCHDGSYSGIGRDSTKVFLPADLARSHPISFTYDSALAMKVADSSLRDPATAQSGFGGTIAQDLLDVRGKMQCTSCHDVHVSGRTPYVLRWDIAASGGERTMCCTCHKK